MGILTIVVGAFGIVGGICGVWSLFYVRDQVKLAQRQLEFMQMDTNERKARDEEDDSWAQRYPNLSTKLLRINPTLQVAEPGQKSATWIYTTMFADPKLRANIENFIIEVNGPGSLFLRRNPRPHEFRFPAMRQTIERAEAEMERFINEHPFCKQHLYG
jgi:hypothetical protein